MGYYAHGSQSAGKVFIKAENVPQAYKAAINTVHDNTMRQDAKTLRDIMSWNGWQSDEDEDGNITFSRFSNDIIPGYILTPKMKEMHSDPEKNVYKILID